MKLNKNLNYKHKASLSLSINIVVIFLISYFFVFPYYNSIIKANAMLMDHRIQFETKLIKEEKFSKISKNLTLIEDDIKKIENAFVDENNKLEFITILEGIVDDKNVDLKLNINFEKMVSNNKIIPLSLVLLGTYDNLMDVLVSIENLKYYINIENIDINNSKSVRNKASVLSGVSSNNILTMNISALSYWK